MNAWSLKSKGHIKTCDPELQRLFNKVLQVQDCTVLCGFRDAEEQREAFRTGHSELDWPNSKHNAMREDHHPDLGASRFAESLAIDVAPCPIDWTDRYRFAWFAGIVRGVASELNIPVRWGGNWDGGDLERQKFDDLVHFELR